MLIYDKQSENDSDLNYYYKYNNISRCAIFTKLHLAIFKDLGEGVVQWRSTFSRGPHNETLVLFQTNYIY